jgi:hypothetical protein
MARTERGLLSTRLADWHTACGEPRNDRCRAYVVVLLLATAPSAMRSISPKIASNSLISRDSSQTSGFFRLGILSLAPPALPPIAAPSPSWVYSHPSPTYGSSRAKDRPGQLDRCVPGRRIRGVDGGGRRKNSWNYPELHTARDNTAQSLLCEGGDIASTGRVSIRYFQLRAS